MNESQETQPKPEAEVPLSAEPCTAFRGPIKQHEGTIRVRVDVQREGTEYWARAVPDPVRPHLMPLASGQTRELAIHAACEKASILHNMSTHTDNERSEAAVDVPRLVRLYDWLRLENHHGETIACGGIFPNEEIKKGQRWQGSSGHTVTIESVNNHSVYYSWVERGAKLTHNKEHFAFQCRYCLILPNAEAIHG